ncbi:MAG: S41 family peptidase [Planctomycetota bacterium]|nr:S41 family peptidase [Planctomycetota bacterium]
MMMQYVLLTAILVSAPPSVYEKDVEFALEEIEKHCGHFFPIKKIDWKKVSKEFRRAARSVKNPREHLILLVRLLARVEDGHAAVTPLEKGKNVSYPAEWRNRSGPGMFWCRSGGKVLVKNSWSSARSAGVRPGMEILQVNGVPVDRWLERRIAELSDRISFSTSQQALYFALHRGLADKPGARMRLDVRSPGSRKKRRLTVRYTRASPAAQGPAFLPEGIQDLRDVKYVRTRKGYGYIHVWRCPGNLPLLVDEALRGIGNVPGMILDFRGNSGGGFDHDALLGRFIPPGRQIAFGKRYRSAGPQPYGGPVVVIVDATVRSAGETASGIFKEDGRAYMIGESPTAGMSSSKTVIELPSRYFSLRVSVHSNKLRFNEGRGIEGIGVPPHQTVEYRAKDLAAGVDTLIQRAEELLGNFPRSRVPYDPAAFGWQFGATLIGDDGDGDLPAEEVAVGGDEHKRYYRMGPRKGAKRPKSGYGLLVILPGGSGGAKFHGFAKRIYRNACDKSYVAVQPLPVRWTEDQEIVWPTGKSPVDGMKFGTEELVESVIADARKWQKIDRRRITLLAWSSSGPAAYAISLQKKKSPSRFFIAMSVFKPRLLPDLRRAKGQPYYLFHSPKDRTCPFRMAQEAERALETSGAAVELATYDGGHGWSGNVFGSIRRGLEWLEDNAPRRSR